MFLFDSSSRCIHYTLIKNDGIINIFFSKTSVYVFITSIFFNISPRMVQVNLFTIFKRVVDYLGEKEGKKKRTDIQIHHVHHSLNSYSNR